MTWITSGCRGGAGSAEPKGPRLAAPGVVAGEGVELEAACVPSGPELCFNAVDDNCNGVIDEGCGVATGVLQFTIAWGDSPADVDLVVTDPTGARVGESTRRAPSGLRLDRDCPREEDGCHGQNVENVVFDGPEPPRGVYKVEVRLEDARGASLPVKVRLGVRVGRTTSSARLELQPGEGKSRRELRFELRP